MPKNMGKGGKSFKAGNAKGVMQDRKRDIIYADTNEGEEYAQVKKPLGNLRLELQLADGSKVIGSIRGAMVRKVWITPGDVVLVSKREFNTNDIVDVIHKYTSDEVKLLVEEKIIPRDFRSTEERDANYANSDYVFVAEEDPKKKEDERKNIIDRSIVILNDPLAEFDDL